MTQQLAAGVLAGERAAIAQAITLVESRRAEHREQAQALLGELLPHSGNAIRIGISGVPGVGKSTFIDQLGVNLIAAGHRVAVLAVDPSSARTGGSILGDKTRMVRLAADENAFVRPSPASGTLGGVAKATRETMLVMEAAGTTWCSSRRSVSDSPSTWSPTWSTPSCSSRSHAPVISCRA